MMRKLLLLFACALVSIGMRASINVWATSTNGVSGYGIYDWDNPGDIAAFLNGTYQGTVYNGGTADSNWAEDLLPLVKQAQTVKLGGNADQPKEPISTADLQALEKLTGVVYLRLDNCFAAEGTDFSQIKIGSSALLDATMPVGLTKEQIKQANDALKATASGLKTTSGITGSIVSEVVTHYWYEIPNVGTFEYTDPVDEGQTSITVSDYAVMADLTLVDGYPKYSFENTRNGNKLTEVTGDIVTINNNTYLVPNPLEVRLTEAQDYYCIIDGKEYPVGWDIMAQRSNYIDEVDGKYYTKNNPWINGANSNAPNGSEIILKSIYKYTRRNWQGTEDVLYTGEVTTDEGGNKVGSIENSYSGGQYGEYFTQYNTVYKYTYTDANGASQEVTYTEEDEDGKIQIDTFSGTLTLSTTYETVSSLVVDGSTVYVNEAGSITDANFMFTNTQNQNYRSGKNITVMGEVNNTDLADLAKFTSAKLVDLSDSEFKESGAGAKIASDFSGRAAASKPVVIIPTPEGSADPTTGSADEVALQSGSITYAYYADGKTKKKMEAWCPNGYSIVLQNLEPVVDKTMTLTFLPDYKADGSFNQYMMMYATAEQDAGKLTSADVLGKLPFGSVDLTWVFYGAAFCDYRNINENTHYIIVPTNSVSAEYDITDESGEKDFKYNDNIWVVATYKGTAAPYATQVYYDGRSLNTAPYASDNQTGFEAEGTTANITYIRKAGTLDGAANLVSDLQKNADRTVIVGKVASSDITAINVMRNKVLDLSGAVLQDGANLSTLRNSYIQYLALPYDSDDDVASFKASQCTGLLGVGKFDTTDKHLYLQSYQEGGMITIMSCLAKATGIEYVTAAGEMNARDLAANSDIFDANGHFVFTETANSNIGKTLSVVEGTAQINGAAIEGALHNRLATGFKGLDITGVKLHQYSEEPSDGKGEFFDYDGTYQNDLHMSTLGYVTADTKATLEYLRLPVDQSVWRIPTSSMNDSKLDLRTLCIPGQYREIGSNAFNNENSLFKITTTRVVGGNGSYDDIYEEYEGSLTGAAGGNTITLPPSLTKIEAGAFGNVEHFTDVYVTSAEVPVCEKDAFGAGTYYGWGGYKQGQDGMAQRTDYGNESSDLHSKAFGVLHWTQNYTIDQVKKLTDIQRVYFHPDREGKTDDRGNLLHWPTLQQIQRAYALASTGYLDGAWMPYVDGATEAHIDGGTGLLDNVYSSSGNSTTQKQADEDYANNGSPVGETYTDYIGWHQFVLVGSWSYAEKYEYKPWNTLCIPYDVTYDNLVNIYGVTKSVNENNKKIIVDSEGFPLKNTGLEGVDATTGEVATDAETLLPTVSTLTSVRRAISYVQDKDGLYVKNEDGTYTQKKKTEIASVPEENRYKVKSGLITLQFTEGMVKKAADEGKVYNWKINDSYVWKANSVSSETGEWEENADGIIMKAGYPYHLKVFVPLGTDNIRTYAINQLKAANVEATASTPADDWIVPTTGNSGSDDLKYQFKGYFDVAEQNIPVPMNSYFLWVPKSGDSRWYRYEASWGADWGKGNPIPSYCAIIGLGSVASPASDLLLVDKASGAQAKASFAISFMEESSEATGISDIQREQNVFGMPAGRVFNMNGQVVSENGSLEGLGKGLYIINGKKYVVK